jgi:hypothetical protein
MRLTAMPFTPSGHFTEQLRSVTYQQHMASAEIVVIILRNGCVEILEPAANQCYNLRI